MNYRTLGSSDLEVSVLAFGAWQIGDSTYWGESAEADADAAVAAAVDAGITLFDTAEGYGGGRSEEILGKVLTPYRDKVLIASKVSPDHCAPADLRAACEASLTRLGTDVIDLYQVHWPCAPEGFADVWGAMNRLKEEGKIRQIGVSNFGPSHLAGWVAAGGCVSNQLGYNLLFRAIENEIVPACQKHGAGILAYMPLLQGILAGRWDTVDAIPASRRRTRHFSADREGVRHGETGCEDLLVETLAGIRGVADRIGQPMANVAIAWAIAQPGVSSVLVGARNPAQLTRNLAAVDLVLSEDVLADLSRITDPLKEHLGANADMWCGNLETRIH
jgi:aryl-alcohol dehydrogenase-like predicted oxidoreductase